MNLIIYTYGHIDAMYYILNGIAMILGSGLGRILIEGVSLTVIAFYGIKAVYAGERGGKQHIVKALGMILVINILLIPKTSMLLHDNVTKQKDKVDNLPLGFAVPIGIMERLGDIMTASFEQGFTPVGSSNYRNYGMVFGARLISEARNFRIKTPEFAQNMDHFIRRCVVMDASMGIKYTINELFESSDVWRLVKESASPLRRVEMRRGGSIELLTCKQAVTNIIEPAFTPEINKVIERYNKTEFARAGSLVGMLAPRGTAVASSFFKKNLETAFGEYLGSNISGETALRQYMMMNAMSDYARTYGFARSSMMQESNWKIAGDLASVYLPMLLSIIKGLVYASFIFMVPLMIMSGGMTRYLSYLSIIASLQLWPALNAILNMFIDLYSGAQIQDLAGGALSFTSYSKVGDLSDKIVAVASGLQMSVPFLAYSIVQGGMNGIMHITGNITGAASSAAQGGAQEVVTGNKSFDNYSAGNVQVASQQGFKTDWNSSYKSGAHDVQEKDGMIERALPNKEVINMMGPGITESSGLSRTSFDTQESNQLQEAYNENMAYREGVEMRKTEAEKVLDTQLKQYADEVSKNSAVSDSNAWETLGTSQEGIREAIDHTKNIGDNFDYAHTQTNLYKSGVDIGGGAEVNTGNLLEKTNTKGTSGKSKKGGKGKDEPVLKVGARINANIGTDFNATSFNTQGINEHTNDSKSNTWNEDKNYLLQAASNEEFNKGMGISKDLTDNISATREKIAGFDKDISKSLAEEKRLEDGISRSRSMGITTSTEITREIRDELLDIRKMSARDADKLLYNPSGAANQERVKFNHAKDVVGWRHKLNHSEKLSSIPLAIDKVRNDMPLQSENKMQDFSSSSSAELDKQHIKNTQKVEKEARKEGIDKKQIKEDVSKRDDNLQKRVDNHNLKIINDAHKIKNKNEVQMNAKQQQVDEEEKNRRTKSVFGREKPKNEE